MSDTHQVVGPEEPIVWEQFETIEQQEEANTFGIWLFLAQEIMFFGGLFAAYAVYRFKFPVEFHQGSLELSIPLGTLNTSVLLLSSLTMAMCVYHTQRSNVKRQIQYLSVTLVLGCLFLFIKWYFEWPAKFAHHLVPVLDWNPAPGTFTDNAHAQMFFVLYFIMTSMHALHMVIGVGIGIWLLWMSKTKRLGENRYLPIEFFGFYWHFVDVVWVFLFPLFYLVS